MLTRNDPFREFDRFFTAARTNNAPIDAYRRDDSVYVEIDLPGVDPQSIDLTVERNVLTVRASRAFSYKDSDQFFLRERSEGTVSRQLFLGDSLDGANVTADYHNGVLFVMIPVAPQAKPRKIEVTQGQSQPVEITS
jgi:HSP20 family protein